MRLPIRRPARSPAICHRKPTGAATVLSFPSGRVEFSADCSRTRSSGRASSRGSGYAQDRGGRLRDGAIAGRPDHHCGTGVRRSARCGSGGPAGHRDGGFAGHGPGGTDRGRPRTESDPGHTGRVRTDPAAAAGDPAPALPADPAAAAAQQAREQAAAQQKALDEAAERQAKAQALAEKRAAQAARAAQRAPNYARVIRRVGVLDTAR